MATAYTAIANGGVLKRPLLVKAIRFHDGEPEKKFKAEEVRRVLSVREAATMRLMLAAATEQKSTGWNARIPGFHVAGKTGTAQKVDMVHGGYMHDAYISSFAGFVPAHDPRFVIYIAVDNPKKAYYGSQVAAPVFAKMAQYLVRRAGLPPVLISESNVFNSHSREERRRASAEQRAIASLSVSQDADIFPNLLGLTLREALAKIRPETSRVIVKGHGFVARTVPPAGSAFKHKRRVFLVLENPD
jgi:cell division protein FtsI (penicillin-binding protein 3)